MRDSIEFDHVTKRYQKNKVVDDLSFTIPKGALCAFLGANGAGKSTSLNMIATLLMPSEGKVYVEGQEIRSSKEEIRKQIGVVFQEDVLDRQLTVYENLYYRGGLYVRDREKLKHRIQEISHLLSIDHMLKKPYATCSGGQKRLVQIGRAILSAPELLILDEPTVGLDPFAREQVWKILKSLNNEIHMTIFYSTHYMEEASLAEMVCILHEGKLLAFQNMKDKISITSQEIKFSRLQKEYFNLLKAIQTDI